MIHDVISGREEWEGWMNALVLDVDDDSIVINLHGIGGIGKTTLLQQWYNSDNCDSLILDFGSEASRYKLSSRISQFIQRLRLLGYDFPIFDYLWTIRAVVIEEKKPASLDAFEKSSFAKMLGDSAKRHLIPFHEDLEGFFNWIRDRWNESKYSSKGQWLTDNLGEQWEKEWLDLLVGPSSNRESWLNILNQAIVNDFNESYKTDNQTLLILIDRFDDIQEVVEADFWCTLLLRMKGTVSVITGRLPINDDICTTISRINLGSLSVDLCKADGIKILELGTLDERGSRNLVDGMEISNEDIADAICRIGNGHPDLLRLLCDSVLKGATIQDIESVESNEMKKVRRKALDVLLRKAGPYIRNFLDLAALTPYFDKSIIFRMDNSFNDDFWNEVLNLSFIRESLAFEEYYEMHDVVRTLLISNWKADATILQQKRNRVISELEESFESTRDVMFLALVLTVSGNLDEESDAVEEMQKIRKKLLDEEVYEGGLQAISYPDYGTNKLKLMQMFAQGDFNKAFGRLYQSIEIFRNAMNIASTDMSKDRHLLIECLEAGEKNGDSYFLLGNHEMALRIYENLVRLYGKISDHYLVWWRLRIAQLLIRFEQYPSAFNHLQGSKEICLRIEGAESIYAGVLDAFGSLYSQRRTGASVIAIDESSNLEIGPDLKEDLSTAERYYSQALELRKGLSKEEPASRELSTNVAATLFNLSRVEILLCKYDLALDHTNKACDIYKQFSSNSEYFSLYVDSLGQIGDIYKFQKDFDNALEFYEIALKEANERANLRYESMNKFRSLILSKLGLLYEQMQNPKKAIEVLNAALEILLELYSLSQSHEKITKLVFHQLVKISSEHNSCSIDTAREELIVVVTNKLNVLNRMELLDNIIN